MPDTTAAPCDSQSHDRVAGIPRHVTLPAAHTSFIHSARTADDLRGARDLS